MNIDPIAMCYILMNLTGQALLTNEKLFSNFGITFRISHNFFQIIVALGLYKRCGGGIIRSRLEDIPGLKNITKGDNSIFSYLMTIMIVGGRKYSCFVLSSHSVNKISTK